MPDGKQVLELLPKTFAVAQLAPETALPDWALSGGFGSITRTADELSIVCEEAAVPAEVHAERGLRCLRVAGPLAFELVGVLESIARPLAAAGVSIFAVSTYDTDYLLVQSADLDSALDALSAAGHSIRRIR
ncbi:MAG: ACT domain-containing protein [Anaerolineales bacterium]